MASFAPLPTASPPLWTDRDFFGWLEPGVHADLIDGEKAMHSPVSLAHARLVKHGTREYWALDPEGLQHRFHFREGEHLVAAEPVDGWIHSREIPEFSVRTEWLNPLRPPGRGRLLAAMADGL